MPQTIVEGALELELGDDWNVVCKWDGSDAYRQGIQKLTGVYKSRGSREREDCKAVDVIAFSESHGKILMIEIKDFREHRIENKERIKNGELFVEVGCKARDTIAGICGAARNGDDADLSVLAARLASQTRLTVVLWLEEDRGAEDIPLAHPKRHKSRLATMTQALKGALRWLTPRVMICSLGGAQLTDHGIVVRPRARSD
ncbi:hypothetical protein [Paraliomyxa miuraensis]|uniref:hypothetical protein n=1 Tax=Paraliomyxa miuraensis TaxID=376150 RepID=UPI002253F087|nr:hypothetical protein [Paraliomyxa miuraensis]MCX4239824.1 hypothetical protein [Paraliomyxa miuraensis]